MKSLIEIYKQDEKVTNSYVIYNIFEVTSDGDPEFIWDDIKRIVKELQYNNQLNYQNFIDKLLAFDDYAELIEEGTDWQDYYIKIYYDEHCIKMIAHDMHSEKVECFRDRLMINVNSEGNCTDDFIKRGVEPVLCNIMDLTNLIKARVDIRKNTTEYHKTACYEKDFTQISLIKRQAQKIIDNCEKHLERISEYYTK